MEAQWLGRLKKLVAARAVEASWRRGESQTGMAGVPGKRGCTWSGRFNSCTSSRAGRCRTRGWKAGGGGIQADPAPCKLGVLDVRGGRTASGSSHVSGILKNEENYPLSSMNLVLQDMQAFAY
jgi:hypothetical protein